MSERIADECDKSDSDRQSHFEESVFKIFTILRGENNEHKVSSYIYTSVISRLTIYIYEVLLSSSTKPNIR